LNVYVFDTDADAVILDYGLDLLSLGRRHPQADLLASADIRMGLINTGVLLLRNTPWMRRFLHQWWYGPHSMPGSADDDSSISSASSTSSASWRNVCDQDAFDRLYAHYTNTWTPESPRMSDKVKVLPMDALNSHPPAMVHQRPESAVLHLMGEHTALRRELFRKAWTNVCAARSGGILPLQLGLKREVLLNYARVIYGDAVQTLLATQQQLAEQDGTSESLLLSQLQVAEKEHGNKDKDLEDGMLTLIVQPLEELSRAAHHLCDALHHLHAVTSDPSFREEEVQLRQRIFQLVMDRTDAAKTAILTLTQQANRTRNAINKHEEDPAAEVPSSDFFLSLAQTMRQRQAMLSVQVQLLKRAAEAGNDLFGAEGDPAEKIKAAVVVLDILDQLEAQVDQHSKHVPKHMQALMHQSLGVLQHALSSSRRDPTDADADAAAPMLAGELSAAHLREAYKHLKTSVALFEAIEKLPNASSEDSSTLMEASRSLQLLAGVTCSLGRYVEGTRRWDEALSHARRSLKGIEIGVRYDNLAVALYNAAVCHYTAGDASAVEELLSEALTIIEGSAGGSTAEEGTEQELSTYHLKKHVLDLRAMNIEQEANSPSSPTVITASASPLAAGAKKEETPAGLMRPVQDPVTGRVTYVRKGQEVGEKMTEQEEEEEEEEWVECELDEPCDEFEIEVGVEIEREVSAAAKAKEFISKSAAQPLLHDYNEQSNHHHASTPADKTIDLSEDPLAGVDVEGMSEEDIAELREVRQRYARYARQEQQQHLQVQQSESTDDAAYTSKDMPPPVTTQQHHSAAVTSTATPLSDPLAKLTDQLERLISIHAQQGLLIEQLTFEIRALREQL